MRSTLFITLVTLALARAAFAADPPPSDSVLAGEWVVGLAAPRDGRSLDQVRASFALRAERLGWPVVATLGEPAEISAARPIVARAAPPFGLDPRRVVRVKLGGADRAAAAL